MVRRIVRRLNSDLCDAVRADSANDEIEQIADVGSAADRCRHELPQSMSVQQRQWKEYADTYLHCTAVSAVALHFLAIPASASERMFAATGRPLTSASLMLPECL